MSQDFTDKVYNLLFNFKNLSSLGTTDGISSILRVFDDKTIYDLSPERYNFYMHVLESINNPNSKILEKVLKQENLTHSQRDRITEKLKNIENYVDIIKNKDPRTKIKEDITKKLGANMLTNDIIVTDIKEEKPTTSPTGGGDGSPELDSLKQYLFNNKENNLTDKFNDTKTDKDLVIKKLMNHPYYSPKNEAVVWSDRAIFIAVTYIIRSIALFMVEWSIYSGYIVRFQAAFGFYFAMYAIIYILLIYLVTSQKDDIFFKTTLFYMNVYSVDGKGYLRNGIHILCLLLLLPIPFIVKDYREFQNTDVLSFEEKRAILNGVDKFSLYMWILTSVIALNV